MKKVTVKQPIEKLNEVPTEVLADSIVAIAAGIKKLRAGRMNDKALYLLIQHAAPTIGKKYPKRNISVADIKAVFEGIESLEATFLKKKIS